MQPYRERRSACPGPVSAFHRATQKPTHRRCGALHVCIAWRIYYHKQQKKMDQTPNSLHRQPLPELPLTGDSEQPEESLQPSCTPSCLDPPNRNIGARKEGEKMAANLSRSYLPDLHSSSCHDNPTPWDDLSSETLKRPVKLLWKEHYEDKYGSRQMEKIKDLSFKDRALEPKISHEVHKSSFDRKRRHKCDSFRSVKRAKQEAEDNQFESLTSPCLDPSAFGVQVQQMSISSLCVSCHSGCRCIISYPGTELHPYQTAPWEPTWNNRADFYFRQQVLKRDFFPPPLYSPLPVRKDAVYFRQRETHPSFLSPQLMTITSSSPSSSSSSWPFGSIQSLPDQKQILP